MSKLTTLRIDDQRRRHAECTANLLQILKTLRGRIGIIGQRLHADLVEEPLRPVEITLVDIDGHDREIRAAHLLLKPVERWHLLTAGYAPRRPEIDEQRLAPQRGDAGRLPVRPCEGEIGDHLRGFRHLHRRHFALGEGLHGSQHLFRARAGLSLIAAGALRPV